MGYLIYQPGWVNLMDLGIEYLIFPHIVHLKPIDKIEISRFDITEAALIIWLYFKPSVANCMLFTGLGCSDY